MKKIVPFFGTTLLLRGISVIITDMPGMKDFLMKQMMQKQLAGLPKEQQEKLLQAVSENPEFFKNLADEITYRTRRGEPQMSAVMAVVGAKKAELSKILGGNLPN